METKSNSYLREEPVGKAVASTMLSMVREIVFGVGFALFLPGIYGLDGVLYSMPVSDALTFAVSIIIIVLTYKQLAGGADAYHKNDIGEKKLSYNIK